MRGTGLQTAAAVPADEFRAVASPWHTLTLVIAEAIIVFRAAAHAQQMRSAADLNRVQMYGRTMLVEWLGLAFVLLGVWLAGSPVSCVLGERWRSAKQFFRDVGIGVGFSILSTILLSGIADHLSGPDPDRTIRFLLPHGRFEMAMWVVLSITAGICEEALYRGYLQRQFMALTSSAPAGIVIAGLAFGLAHSYQGVAKAAVIGVEGALLGMPAHWRRSVRPGMIAHAFKDSLAPILMIAVKH